MTQRTPLIAANWKMNSAPEGLKSYQSTHNVDVIVFPTYFDLLSCIEAKLTVGAQFAHPEEHGAHTGDVSMTMIKALGCTHVLCGHSERRQYHGETDDFVAAQVAAALENGLHPILCVGETDEERKTGREKEIVQTQLNAAIQQLNNASITIAYEPVWAIGTGNTATPEDAEEMHAFIRELLTAHSSQLTATRILYGGSMNPGNAADLLAQPNIDGGLVGGASLDPGKFAEIIKCAASV